MHSAIAEHYSPYNGMKERAARGTCNTPAHDDLWEGAADHFCYLFWKKDCLRLDYPQRGLSQHSHAASFSFMLSFTKASCCAFLPGG